MVYKVEQGMVLKNRNVPKAIPVGELFSNEAISVAFCVVLKKSEGSPPKVGRNCIFTLKHMLWLKISNHKVVCQCVLH